MNDYTRRVLLASSIIVLLAGCKISDPVEVQDPTPVVAELASAPVVEEVAKAAPAQVEPSARLVTSEWGSSSYIELTEVTGKVRKVYPRGSSQISVVTSHGKYLISKDGKLLKFEAR